MNEKLQYASMLEIPVSTCNITLQPLKKRRFRKKKKADTEAVKNKLIEKVNSEVQTENLEENLEDLTEKENVIEQVYEENLNNEEFEEQTIVEPVENKRKKFKFSIIGVQLTLIGVLVATIFLTNALYEDSGINVFLRSVFKTEQASVIDDRGHEEFTPVLSFNGSEVSVNDGIMSFAGSGSVYSPCDGTVTSVVVGEDGKYTVEITHSTNFKSILTGIDYAYAGLEQKVYGNIPVGYIKESATMCFVNQTGAVISNYQIVDGSVVWAV